MARADRLTEALAQVGGESGLLLLIVHFVLWHPDPVEPRTRDELDEQGPDEAQRANADANEVLLKGERHCAQRPASKLDGEDLDAPHESIDRNEHPVVEEIGEDIELLLTKLTGIDHVEKLHCDEGMVYDGVELDLGGGLTLNVTCAGMIGNPVSIRVERIIRLVVNAKESATVEEKGEEDTDLQEAVHQYIAPHSTVDDHCLTVFRHSAFHDASIRRLSSEGKCGECVHDEVDPEHLH